MFACYQPRPILLQTTLILVLPRWHWSPMKCTQGWHGEGHNWHPDVGRDLLGGDPLWQGGGGGAGGHTGFNWNWTSTRYIQTQQWYTFVTHSIQGSFDKNSTVRDCATIFALSLMTRFFSEFRNISFNNFAQLSAGVQSLQQHPGGWPPGELKWLCFQLKHCPSASSLLHGVWPAGTRRFRTSSISEASVPCEGLAGISPAAKKETVGKIVLVHHNNEKDWWHFCSFHMNTRMVQREGQLCLGNRSRWINRIFLKKFSIGGRNGFLTSNKNSPGLFEGGGEAASWAAGMKLKFLQQHCSRLFIESSLNWLPVKIVKTNNTRIQIVLWLPDVASQFSL